MRLGLLILLVICAFHEVSAQSILVWNVRNGLLTSYDTIFNNDTIAIDEFLCKKRKDVLLRQDVRIYQNGFIIKESKNWLGTWKESIYTRDSTGKLLVTESYSSTGELISRTEYKYIDDTVITNTSRNGSNYVSKYLTDSLGTFQSMRFQDNKLLEWQKRTHTECDSVEYSYYVKCDEKGREIDTFSYTVYNPLLHTVQTVVFSDSGTVAQTYLDQLDSTGRSEKLITAIVESDYDIEPIGVYISEYQYFGKCETFIKKTITTSYGTGSKDRRITYKVWRKGQYPPPIKD